MSVYMTMRIAEKPEINRQAASRLDLQDIIGVINAKHRTASPAVGPPKMTLQSHLRRTFKK